MLARTFSLLERMGESPQRQLNKEERENKARGSAGQAERKEDFPGCIVPCALRRFLANLSKAVDDTKLIGFAASIKSRSWGIDAATFRPGPSC